MQPLRSAQPWVLLPPRGQLLAVRGHQWISAAAPHTSELPPRARVVLRAGAAFAAGAGAVEGLAGRRRRQRPLQPCVRVAVEDGEAIGRVSVEFEVPTAWQPSTPSAASSASPPEPLPGRGKLRLDRGLARTVPEVTVQQRQR
eukprot:CAMPEP_0203920018 /NCGR_PEP_ID=MMETSP0359-20131031/60369_1 /ASSEMBLY_ACC=CAM_ASM_000338 /TAXON_ID=268821 /ORGANISM="Scrippsiella Hangoei, Strain SHTV-5" /LENGTH=142 /DNA_ID=CAMNT_0050847425 /DNA_START=30 /DNA_END=454 /DNA_ORIENTATION=+